MDYQTIIETFFSMVGRFDFDRAKSYIDGRKEVLQKVATTFPNQPQLMTMLSTFSHLAEVEKNYHHQPFFNQQTHHSFLPAASFLRKAKSLKDMYSDIFSELQQLENMDHVSDELISHFCRQLQNFIQARLDMIDVYEKLVDAFGQKYTSVEGISFKLIMLCRQYHKYFHHPLLAPIKEGMTLECESLMMLIRATIDLQHWRFLPTLFDIQDAQSKLSYWAACTFNKEAYRRRFKVSKTPAPRLYEWLCKFKDFLVAKFTLYFHSTLMTSLTSTTFKSSCSKLTVDYYSKLSSVQRKVDALFIALMYDVSNEKDFRGAGYNFPTSNSQKPQGKNTLQPMVVIPAEGRSKLSNLQAEIYMTVMTNQQVVTKEGHYQFHDSIKKLTYSITKLDFNVVLVTVCEGQKPDRDAHIRAFYLELTHQFSFLNIFSN